MKTGLRVSQEKLNCLGCNKSGKIIKQENWELQEFFLKFGSKHENFRKKAF